jgi:hypothetical protein
VTQEDAVNPDDIDVHRDGDRNYWVTQDPKDFADFWDDEPTHEKWRRGAKWR